MKIPPRPELASAPGLGRIDKRPSFVELSPEHFLSCGTDLRHWFDLGTLTQLIMYTVFRLWENRSEDAGAVVGFLAFRSLQGCFASPMVATPASHLQSHFQAQSTILWSPPGGLIYPLRVSAYLAHSLPGLIHMCSERTSTILPRDEDTSAMPFGEMYRN